MGVHKLLLEVTLAGTCCIVHSEVFWYVHVSVFRVHLIATNYVADTQNCAIKSDHNFINSLPFSLLDLVTHLWTPILSMLVALMASDFVEGKQLEAMQLLWCWMWLVVSCARVPTRAMLSLLKAGTVVDKQHPPHLQVRLHLHLVMEKKTEKLAYILSISKRNNALDRHFITVWQVWVGSTLLNL